MMRLSPLDQLMVLAWNGRAFALFNLGRYEDGCASAMKSIQFVQDAHTLSAFIVNAIRAGRAADARETAAQLLSLQPDFSATHAQEAFPVRSSDMRSRIIAALREAGLPG
jgi:hypothetical protein